MGLLGWALALLIVAIFAAAFGFGRISAAATDIAKVLFFIFVALFVVLLVAGLLSGCGKKENRGGQASPEAERLRQEASEALEAARDFTIAKKEDFTKMMQINLDKLEQKMQDLKAKAQAKGEEVAAEFEKRRPEFDEKVAQAKQALAKARDAGGEAWQGAKNAAQAAYEELEKTYNEIAAKFK